MQKIVGKSCSDPSLIGSNGDCTASPEPINLVFPNSKLMKEFTENLSYQDLEKLIVANPSQRLILEPLVHFMKIIIDFKKFRTSSQVTVTVEGKIGLAGKIKRYSFEYGKDPKAMQALRSSLAHFPSIYLSVTGPYLSMQAESIPFIPMLVELGPRVHTFEPLDEDSYNNNFEHYFFYLSKFPNLRELRCGRFSLDRFSFYSKLTLKTPISLLHLKKIQWGDGVSSGVWAKILDSAPNVEEIQDFLPSHWKLLKSRGGRGLVKSLALNSSAHNGRDESSQLGSDLKSLADLGIELKYTPLPSADGFGFDPERATAKKINLAFRQVLKSSEKTLQVLTIPPVDPEFDEFCNLRGLRLEAVKNLHFRNERHRDWSVYNAYDVHPRAFEWHTNELGAGRCFFLDESHYFPPKTDLKCIFPHLESIDISFSMLKEDFSRRFPLRIFGPQKLGSSIRKLKIQGVSPECLQLVIVTFPHVVHLEMESTLGHFNKCFPIICRGWSLLESLTVNIDLHRGLHQDEADYSIDNCVNFDSVIIGIPPEICDQLKQDGSSMEDVKIHRESRPSLLWLTRLRKLEFNFIGRNFRCKFCKKCHSPSIMSRISGIYALKFLPDLKVVARLTRRQCNFRTLEQALEPVSEFIDLDDNPLESHFMQNSDYYVPLW